MDKRTISVIMPNYNCALYVAQAIDSVLAQTYRPLELLAVDDESTDGSREIIASYGKDVRLISLTHTGRPGYVRNRGIESARGSLIAFIDADDIWLCEKLAKQVAYLEEHQNIGLVHSNLRVIDSQGRYLRDIFLGCRGSQGLTDDCPESSFTQLIKGDSSVWTSSVLTRRACLNRVGGFSETLTVGEDYHLWIRIAREFQVAYIPEALAIHRKHGANTGKSWARAVPQEVQLWNEMLDLFPELQTTHGYLIHAKFFFHYIVNAMHCVNHHCYLAAAKLLAAGVMTHLPRTRLRYLKEIARKYVMIRRLQSEGLTPTRLSK
jgi:glycosyltransferase involved in cell wall biosynthesis